MSDRVWQSCVRIGSLFFVLAVLLIAAAFPHDGRFTVERAKEAQSYDAASDYDACKTLLGPLRSDVAADTSQPETDKPKKDRYYELCQQTRSADGALRAASYAWWQTAISGFAFVALLVTVYFTGLAALHTAEAANAASKQVEHAGRQIEIVALDQRPWITVETTLVEYERTAADFRSVVIITVKNIGRTPAIDVRINVPQATILAPGTDATYSSIEMIRSEMERSRTGSPEGLYGPTYFPQKETIENHLVWGHVDRSAAVFFVKTDG